MVILLLIPKYNLLLIRLLHIHVLHIFQEIRIGQILPFFESPLAYWHIAMRIMDMGQFQFAIYHTPHIRYPGHAHEIRSHPPLSQ